MGEYTLVKIVKSDKSGKKMMAVFRNKKTGREKVTHFGDATMSDYTKHKNDKRKKSYRSRAKHNLPSGDPTRASYLSYYILWGESTSLRENIAAYKRRFFPGSSRKTSPKRRQSSPKKSGLERWFKEKWIDVKTGKPCGRKKGENRAYPACRPSKRISDKTPKTSGEMSASEKAKFKKVKKDSTKIPYQHRRTSPTKKKMSTPLCPRGKAAAKRKFQVYPSAYANAYASKICAGKIKDDKGMKRKDFKGPKPRKTSPIKKR